MEKLVSTDGCSALTLTWERQRNAERTSGSPSSAATQRNAWSDPYILNELISMKNCVLDFQTASIRYLKRANYLIVYYIFDKYIVYQKYSIFMN